MTTAEFLKKEFPTLLLLVVPFIAIPFLWDKLPDTVPIHFDGQGNPDDYGSKALGLFLLPCINIGVYLLFALIPVIDPKRRVSFHKKPLPALRFFLVLIFTIFFFITVAAMLGIEGFFSIDNLAPLAVILMFFALGNYLSSVQPNYFIGIRTPWTLEDPEIWRQTHRFGGSLWVAVSCLLLVLWLVLPGAVFDTIFVPGIIAMALVPVIYSYVLYARKKKDVGTKIDQE